MANACDKAFIVYVFKNIRNNLKGYSTFLEIGSFYHSPRVGFYRFRMYSDDFLIFRRISVTTQFLVSLTSIVYFFSYYGSQ